MGETKGAGQIHVDSAQAHSELLNSRMAYVSVSRAQYDVQMYTNDAKTLGQELSRDVSKSVALQSDSVIQKEDIQMTNGRDLGQSLSLRLGT